MQTEQHDSSPPTVTCPRCGYDQRGAVATWKDACPLNGICAECGLEFRWGEVLGVKARGPGWCVEFARTRRQVPRRAITTLFMMLRPWRFWTELDITHLFRPGRILMLFVLLAALTGLCIPMGVGRAAARGAMRNTAELWPTIRTALYAATLPLSENPPAWYVRPPNSVWAWNQEYNMGKYRRPVPADFAFAFAVHGPSARRFELAVAARNPQILKPPECLLTALCLALMMPLGFLALPVSSRRYKVRAVHLARIAMYSMIPIALIVLYWAVRVAWSPTMLSGRPAWLTPWPDVQALAFYGMPAFLVFWWSFAIKGYLRTPHGLLISVCFVALACLLLVFACELLIVMGYP